MKLRFKILLALMLPIVTILVETFSGILITLNILPLLIKQQQSQQKILQSGYNQTLSQSCILQSQQTLQQILSFQDLINSLHSKNNTLGLLDYLQEEKISQPNSTSNQTNSLLDTKNIPIVITENAKLYLLGTTLLSVQMVISFVFLLYVWRTSIIVGLSLEIPIQTLIETIDIGINNLENQEFTVDSHVKLFNSKEIASLYSTMIHFVNNIKYSNNKLWDIEISEARTLIAQCQSAEFYKKYENLTAVGICANNISRIHMKNKRFMEAMNEQELSIMIAYQELNQLKQYKKLCKEEKTNLLQTIKQKFWFQKYQPINSEKQKLGQSIGLKIIGDDLKSSNKFISQKFIKQDSFRLDQKDDQHFKKPFLQSNWVQRKQVDVKQKKLKLEQVDENRSLSIQRSPHKSLENSNLNLISNISQKKIKKPYQIKEIKATTNANNFQTQHQHQTIQQLLAIKKQKEITKLKLIYRNYQLATILFNYSLKNETLFSNGTQNIIMKESVRLFTQIYSDSQKLIPLTKSLKTLQINILTKKAICLIRKGQRDNAFTALELAKQIFNDLEGNINIPDICDQQGSEEFHFVDILKDIPLEILDEKLKSCYAMLDMMDGQFYEASIKFMQILESESFFDPGIQTFSIKALKSIFKFYHQPVAQLNDFQGQLIQKDLEIIVLIDYTSDMSTEQLTLSHTMCKYILDQLRPQDQIGLYAFNEILYEAFPLQKKIAYRELLEQTIKQLLIYPGGQGNLFKLLQLCASFLFDLQSSYSQKKLMKYLKSVQDLNPQTPQSQNFIQNNIAKFSSASEATNIQNRNKSQTIGQKKKSLGYLNKGNFSDLNKLKISIGDKNEYCIDEILKVQDSDIFSDEEGVDVKKFNLFEIDHEIIQQEEADPKKIRYICLFSEGVKQFDHKELDKLKIILLKKNIHLIVFNIANQNANMLYLKMLSEITDQSQFFTSDTQMINFFETFSQKQQSRRTYLEFF